MSQTGVVVEITPDVIREQRFDGRLIVYTVRDSSRENIEAYINDALKVMKAMTPGQKLYTLHDISARTVSLTPHFRSRLNDIADYIRAHKLTGKSAVVLPDTFMNRIFALFATSFTRRAALEQRMFTRLDDATRWMEAVVQADTAPVIS